MQRITVSHNAPNVTTENGNITGEMLELSNDTLLGIKISVIPIICEININHF